MGALARQKNPIAIETRDLAASSDYLGAWGREGVHGSRRSPEAEDEKKRLSPSEAQVCRCVREGVCGGGERRHMYGHQDVTCTCK